MRDLSAERADALAYAVELHRTRFQRCDGPDVLRTASKFFDWLTAPISLRLTTGPAVDQTTGTPTGNLEGNPMKDTEKSQIMVTAMDAKGQPTAVGTDITFTSADTSIASISTDPDGTVWIVAGVPGSTVITGDWPDSPIGDLQGTLAVDVTAGDAASLQISAGPAVPQ